MIFTDIQTCKAFLAMHTLILFLFGMSANVIFEGSRMCKVFLAMHTLIRFLFGVTSHEMTIQRTPMITHNMCDSTHWYRVPRVPMMLLGSFQIINTIFPLSLFMYNYVFEDLLTL